MNNGIFFVCKKIKSVNCSKISEIFGDTWRVVGHSCPWADIPDDGITDDEEQGEGSDEALPSKVP